MKIIRELVINQLLVNFFLRVKMHCKLCNSPNLEYLTTCSDIELRTTEQLYKYYQCSDCRAVFIDHFPLDILKTIYPNTYYSNNTESNGFLYQIKDWFDLRLIRKVLSDIDGSSKLSVLDVGGGSGLFLAMLKTRINNIGYTAVNDISDTAEQIAKENGHDYFKGSLEEIELNINFDLIIMQNIIEHVADPSALMNKAQELLKPGGQIILKTPNTDSINFRTFKKSYWGGYHCPRHWILFNKENLTDLLLRNNLFVHKTIYTQGAPQWVCSLLPWFERLKLISLPHSVPIMHLKISFLITVFTATFDFLTRFFRKTDQMIFFVGKKTESAP